MPGKLPGSEVPAAPSGFPAAPTGFPSATTSSLPAPGGLPKGLPGPSTSDPPPATASAEEPDDEEEEESPQDETWKQIADNDDSSTNDGDDDGDSGDDSDALPESQIRESDPDRRKNDMDVLLRQQYRSGFPQQVAAKNDDDDNTSVAPSEANQVSNDYDHLLSESQNSSQQASLKKKSVLSRLFFGSSANVTENHVPGNNLITLLKEEGTRHDDGWYHRWGLRLAKDGLGCTKVATNGKPYERRVHLDSRNLTIEIRGGRGRPTGVLLDDLVDMRQGLMSPEFEKFCSRFKKDILPAEFSKRALVLQTPTRTFSFVFNAETQRDTVSHFIVYLLKSKNRGMTASGNSSAQCEKVPRDGQGKVTYPNRSTYEGQFQQYMRHGKGILTLSEGTKYDSEWRNDERHGKGKEIWADGTIFVGSYIKGMRHGHGVMTWPEGSKYSGHFERGRANGVGELVRTDGSVYRGQFSEDCMSGEGRMHWRDGVEYTGHFIANRREGLGKMVWTSGRWKSYEGHWKDGVQHGHGTLTDQSDQEFSGTFCSGKLERWDDDVQS